jgi:hypothetical protein
VRPDFPGLCGRFLGEKANGVGRLPFRRAWCHAPSWRNPDNPRPCTARRSFPEPKGRKFLILADALGNASLERARAMLSGDLERDERPLIVQARRCAIALTRAIAATADEPMLAPGGLADASARLLVLYLIATTFR